MIKAKIKKDDIVQVISGKDKGKKGKVLEVLSSENRAVVQGINLVKKHMRQTRQDQKAGIVSLEKPLNIGKLMLVCKSCNRPTRIAVKILSDGNKSRVCKKCKEVL